MWQIDDVAIDDMDGYRGHYQRTTLVGMRMWHVYMGM
jgi:hypothetical protein